jgi:DNA-binding NtrC family response regulator
MCLYGFGSALVLLAETDRESAAHQARSLVRTGHLGEPPLVCGIAMYPDAGTSHELVDAVRRAARTATPSKPVAVANAVDDHDDKSSVVIVSEAMREVFDLVRRLATSTIPVLIQGETGTGKEVVARAIHNAGPRKTEPMRSINCGAIPANLIESVLFGHEKGAFTGAEQSSPGIFEQADGGTVFMDEVGELSQAAQAALLRVLETKRVTRVGGTEEKKVDVRVLAATHRDLEKMVQNGQFRMDLLYRLNTMMLSVPALRDRVEEIEPLAELFLSEANRLNGTAVSGIRDDARRLLRTYAWPGNVRELRNEIERAAVICRGTEILGDDLSERVRGTSPDALAKPTAIPPALVEDVDFKERVRQYEVNLILSALKRCEGNQTQAAKMLRIPLRTLVHKIKAYGIRKMYEA